MSKPVIKCHPSTTMEEALRIMMSHQIRRLMVTKNDEIIGELSVSTIVGAYFMQPASD